MSGSLHAPNSGRQKSNIGVRKDSGVRLEIARRIKFSIGFESFVRCNHVSYN
jgi:hypothetical protein